MYDYYTQPELFDYEDKPAVAVSGGDDDIVAGSETSENRRVTYVDNVAIISTLPSSEVTLDATNTKSDQPAVESATQDAPKTER